MLKGLRKSRRSRRGRRGKNGSRRRQVLQSGGASLPATWAIIQYDNRPLSATMNAAIDINRKYTKKHNYKHMLFSDNYFVPPYWVKVFLTKRILDVKDPQTGMPLFKGVIFLDTDAVIVDHDKSLDSLMEGRRSFVASSDIGYAANPASGIFNAGVFIVKNNDDVKQLLTDWIALYKPKDWTLDGDTWSTTMPWAGVAYEQGSFSEHIYPKYKDKVVEIADVTILQSLYQPSSTYIKGNGNFKKDNIFTMHFAAGNKNELMDKFIADYKAANP